MSKVTSSPISPKRGGSGSGHLSPTHGHNRSLLEWSSQKPPSGAGDSNSKNMTSVPSCQCDSLKQNGYENYDIPRNLSRQRQVKLFYTVVKNIHSGSNVVHSATMEIKVATNQRSEKQF